MAETEINQGDWTALYKELAERTTLSEKQAKVVAYKKMGLDHAEIANKMDIHEATVGTHSHRAGSKFRMAHSTIQNLRDVYSHDKEKTTSTDS